MEMWVPQLYFGQLQSQISKETQNYNVKSNMHLSFFFFFIGMHSKEKFCLMGDETFIPVFNLVFYISKNQILS